MRESSLDMLFDSSNNSENDVSDKVELIGRRRRQILVHSFLYYQQNTNIISDHTYDMWSRELVELQQQYPKESQEAVYADAFVTFDGSTGYDLPYTHPDIQNTGLKLLRYTKRLEG